jgi:hypothetical protein
MGSISDHRALRVSLVRAAIKIVNRSGGAAAASLSASSVMKAATSL